MDRKQYSPTLVRAVSLAAVLMLTFTVAAQTEKTIHPFNGINHIDGSGPEGNVVADSAGNLYGTAFGSGSAGVGIVYKLSRPVPPSGTWTESILHAFTGPDGANPAGGLIFDSAGNLYGTTAYGGNGPCTVLAVVIGCGVVFELSPPATSGGSWTESVLYNFQFGSDSGGSRAPLIFDSAGNLYGTTSGQGFDSAFADPGAVFQLGPPPLPGGAWTETTILSFPAFLLGANPFAPVAFDASGNLYGTTFFGGDRGCTATSLGCGVIFQLAPPSLPGGSWTETVLHTFAGKRHDGSNPVGGVAITPSGALFGTTSTGSTFGGGTVFAMQPPSSLGGAWTYANIYAFGGTGDGVASRAAVTFGLGRTLYGTTSRGGTLDDGTVFRLTPPISPGSPWTETILHSFQYSTTNHTDGNIPYGGVIVYKGALVGTTLGGGSKNSGTVYSLFP